MEELDKVVQRPLRPDLAEPPSEEELNNAWKLKSSFIIDQKNAYDSVPREARWLAQKKLGVPSETVQLIPQDRSLLE